MIHETNAPRSITEPLIAQSRAEGANLTDVLERAARAVVREALDNVDVHPCDENNDEVRGSKLYGPMRDLYEALRSN